MNTQLVLFMTALGKYLLSMAPEKESKLSDYNLQNAIGWPYT